MLTIYDWVYGITTLSVVFLSIIAGLIALSMFGATSQRKYLAAWKPLLIALVLFAIEEIIGALKIFGIYSNPWITHVMVSFVLVFFIAALIRQIDITRGCHE
ncbi:MAG: hypothetical protein NTW67_04745 [Candidatus Woesearchaeota archaeon]|nr:hypothetical protein [Candidatus Woesearchaeota archaeon]